MRLDTRNGSFHTKEFRVSRNNAYLIFQKFDGTELGRLENPGKMEDILAEMRRVLEQTSLDRPEMIRYLATYRPLTPEVREDVEEQMDKLGHPQPAVREEASSRLAEMGYPAFQILSAAPESADAEVRARVRAILDVLRPLHELVEARGLDHDVEFLLRAAARHEDASKRLRSILPGEAPARPCEVAEWWKKHGAAYRWDAESQKFIARDPGDRKY